MIAVDENYLRAVAPAYSGAQAAQQNTIITAIGADLAPTLQQYGVDTGLRIAHFTAQVVYESAGLSTTVEESSGAQYEGNASLGNTQPGDGERFKGRGLIQLTGRANYTQYGKLLGVDLVDNPDQAAQPLLSLRIACEFWKINDIDAPADVDDLPGVTARVNGPGMLGLKGRGAYLVKAKAALETITGSPVAEPPGGPVLRLRAFGPEVTKLQTALNAKGITVAESGEFDTATQQAVEQFQAKDGMTADGVVGPATWAKLNA